MTQLTLTDAQRQSISDMMQQRMAESSFPSQARFSRSIGITPSDYSNIANGSWKANARLVGTGKWMRVAREVGFSFSSAPKWNSAETTIYGVITAQLDLCQKESTTLMFCDLAGFGKTWACQQYAKQNANVYYVDCSVTPNKLAFIRALAKAVGIDPEKDNANGVFTETVYYLRALSNPLIIIDEAGDSDDSTYLLIKRMWNQLEGCCGIYMIGARGLRRRIDRGIALRKNGFEELFSRFGCKYTEVVPKAGSEQVAFLIEEGKLIAEANGIKDKHTINGIMSQLTVKDDLRVVQRQVLKAKRK